MNIVNSSSTSSAGVRIGRPAPLKKRRIPGACDVCKRRKIRCNSAEMPDNRCSHCVEYGFDCTHREVIKSLGSAKGYVASLEARLEKMDRLLAKFLPPGTDINKEIDHLDFTESSISESPLTRNDDEDDQTILGAFQYRKEKRYFGKSSGFRLLQTAVEARQEYTGEKAEAKPLLPPERHEIWDYPSWASTNPENDEILPDYAYPDEDLAPSLVSAYFDQINHLLPLLHRPTFERLVEGGLHYVDPCFGAVYSLVCAHGARYSLDPRVLADGTDSPRSAGWKWFEQVKAFRDSYVKKPSLYELQMIALHTMFVQTMEAPQGAWAEIGLGVRLAQELGLHRRRRKSDTVPSAQDELWKRAFWVILCLDRTASAFLGRPCSLQDEDLDLYLPIECDDEYWEHGFQQPADKPSSVAYFIRFLKLMDILASAMRLIYSIKRPRYLFGRGAPLSEHEIVVDLDSTMNNWMSSVPAHLKWNPNCTNKLFLKQSAALHAMYYLLQIYIHRPFIPSPRNPDPGILPSLAICTNAARSCCHVLETFTGLSLLPLVQFQLAVFMSAVILLLNIWSGKRAGYAPNPSMDLEDVQRCLEILRMSEDRWASAARYRDILIELASAGDLSIPSSRACTPIDTTFGREHNLETIPGQSLLVPNMTSGGGSVPVAGNFATSLASSSRQPASFSLPLYSNELGRLPVYGQFNFSNGTMMTGTPAEDIDRHDSTMAFQNQNFTSLPETPFSSGSTATGENVQVLPTTSGSGADSTIHTDDAENIFSSPFDNEIWFQGMPLMDDDTMNMWSMAPNSVELEDWNTYFTSMEQATQSRGH